MSTSSQRRLDPCPCGSGRRYKDCHGSLGAAPQHASQRDAAAISRRGHERHDAMDLDGALANFEAAITLDPSFAQAHHNRGLTADARRLCARLAGIGVAHANAGHCIRG
jgi:hypothetical protein